jgi:hypothetical protein
MTTERILYTDGHGVTVTDSAIKVRGKFYRMEGITRHGFAVIKQNLMPGMMIVLLGLLMVISGFTRTVQGNFFLEVFSYYISAQSLVIGTGAVLMAVGFWVMSIHREKYAVHIVTAEGEKNVLVSKQKEYVTQVLEAMNKAFLSLLQGEKSNASGTRPRHMAVSGR